MKENEQIFTTRQYMVRPDFEIFHYSNQPSLEVDYHQHDFCEIYLLLSGKVNYIIEGRKYMLRRDDLILISNQELHRPDIATGAVYERIVLWVNPEYIRSLGTSESNLLACFERTPKSRPNLIRPGGAALAGIKSLMHRLNQTASAPTGRFGEDVLRQAYLAELLVLINQAFLEEVPDSLDEDIASDPTINDIIRHINQNLADALSLDALAERFYISKYHLARQFKKHAGFTLYSYILHKRLILAKSFLAEDRSLADICRLCGFNDYANFIRAFKKVYHLTPKRYARQQG